MEQALLPFGYLSDKNPGYKRRVINGKPYILATIHKVYDGKNVQFKIELAEERLFQESIYFRSIDEWFTGVKLLKEIGI